MKLLKLSLFAASILMLVFCVPGKSSFHPFKHVKGVFADTTKKDTVIYETIKGLPLKAQRKINFTTSEGTWTSLDISPDGKTIVFDMMGDIYTVPVGGGTATAITKGLAFDFHPRYSPDGKRLVFISDRSGADNVWYIDFDKKDTVQLTKEKNQEFVDATWTPDGGYIIYSIA